MLHQDLTEQIIKAYYKVHRTLGFGFLEKVYENALVLELKRMQLNVEKQKPIKVYYEKEVIGEYYADVVVNNLIIIELKTAETLCKEHEFQLINYLKATKIEIGLLLNFGVKPQITRKIFTNDRK